VRVEVITALTTAFGTLVVGSATAWVAVRSAKTSLADKLLSAMKEEAALLAELPEGSSAREQLQKHLEWMAERYIPERSVQVQVKIEWSAVIGSLVLGAAAATLGFWATLTGGWALLWNTLAIPVLLACVYGFFHEASGGESRARLLRETTVIGERVGSLPGNQR